MKQKENNTKKGKAYREIKFINTDKKASKRGK